MNPTYSPSGIHNDVSSLTMSRNTLYKVMCHVPVDEHLAKQI